MPDPRRQVIEKGVKQLLDEQKVPLSMHLRFLRMLKESIQEHKGKTEEYTKTVKENTSRLSQHDEHIKALADEIKRVHTLKQGAAGKDGRHGRDGTDGGSPSVEEVVRMLIPHIPAPLPGPKGKDGAPGKGAVEVDEEKLLTKVIRRIQQGNLIHIKDVAGAASFLKGGVQYKTEELMHGGGVKEYVPTGTIDGVNTTFTLPSASSNWKVYADGARQRSTKDYTIVGTVLTFTFPPTSTVICDL